MPVRERGKTVQELSYLLTTPYTIVKSRTGGVLSRLLSRLDLELVAAQMIAPTEELAFQYAESMLKNKNERVPQSSQILHDYILNTFSPSEGRRHRVLMLLFRGKDAVKKLSDIAGAIYPENRSIESVKGETIRDTYADLIMDPRNKSRVLYFEPAVLTPHSQKTAFRNLKMFADFAAKEENIIENIIYENPEKIERTLVIIKPDNWRYPSSRPGTIIDMFARTGLRIIGCKIYQMSVSEALEFYGSVRDVLKEKLSPIAGKMAAETLTEKYGFKLKKKDIDGLATAFGIPYAEDQFARIVHFMTGNFPGKGTRQDKNKPGKVKCMVLVYEGENAVQRIRDVLGPTDPTKAPGGTVRREFGSDIMVNTAHASDSVQNAKREMEIVKINKNQLSQIIRDYLKSCGEL
ncbi:MAG: nucleoside-diphosphate kinase [Spirochaetales bacterium]|nr:nucleoside-diphosphate kinase [Spirochaetales bacterium]